MLENYYDRGVEVTLKIENKFKNLRLLAHLRYGQRSRADGHDI